MSLKRSLKYFLPFAFIAFLWTSCSDDQLFQGNARIQTTFRLKSPTAMGGSVTIREAYLKLNSLGVTGTLGDQNVPPATYPVASDEPPYKLTQADSAQVTLTLPSHVYDLLDLHLLLFESKYQLISLHQPAEPAPQPVTGNNGGASSGDGGTAGGSDSGGNEGTSDKGQDSGEETPAGDGDTSGQPGDNGGNNNNDDDGGDASPDNGGDPGEDDNTGEGDKDDKDEKKDDDKEDKEEKNDKDNKGNDGDKDDDDDDDKDDDDDDKDDDKDDDDKDDGRARGQVDGTVDLDDFFQNAKPSLVVFATWNMNGENINIVFAVTDVERITIRATQNGDHRVMLADQGTASVTFDPEQWFQSISTADLQNASRQIYQGQPVVFIHHDHNTALFNVLYSSLVESATFDFSLPAVE